MEHNFFYFSSGCSHLLGDELSAPNPGRYGMSNDGGLA